MAFVRFTPANEGDEYHTTGLSCRTAGVFEVDQDRATYLVATFPLRFSHCTDEGEVINNPAPTKVEPEAPQDPQHPSNDTSPSKSVSKMNKDELTAYASELGVEIDEDMTNKDLKQAIKSHEDGGA